MKIMLKDILSAFHLYLNVFYVQLNFSRVDEETDAQKLSQWIDFSYSAHLFSL